MLITRRLVIVLTGLMFSWSAAQATPMGIDAYWLSETTPAFAPEADVIAIPPRPVVSIIIDDVGYSRHADAFAASGLHLTYAILPHAPHSLRLARQLKQQNREVMLHLPMQSTLEQANRSPGLLVTGMNKPDFIQTLQYNLTELAPYIQGINNHQGSMLSADTVTMNWLMEYLAEYNQTAVQPWYMVDSRTTTATVIEPLARQHAVPTVRRHVFLDNQRDVAAIKQQVQKLLSKAQRQGYAVGIGHPYPETLQALQESVSEFQQQIDMVSVSQLIMIKSTLTQ